MASKKVSRLDYSCAPELGTAQLGVLDPATSTVLGCSNHRTTAVARTAGAGVYLGKHSARASRPAVAVEHTISVTSRYTLIHDVLH